jgi:NodT family efflux transporter outer membrane factor (OMF) lipoprotein
MSALMLMTLLAAPVVSVPLPPTPAGNAPASVLSAPIAPEQGPAQSIVLGDPVPAQWWQAFGSAKLDALVATALKGSDDIAAADALLRQAEELAKAAGGARLPTLDASYGVTRARVSNSLSTPLYDTNAMLYSLHTAQVSVGYTLDVFGGVSAKVRSAEAAAKAQKWRSHAARQVVVANLVQAVINRGALIEEVAATQESIAAASDLLELTRRRAKIGSVGTSDVAAQETALAAAQGALPMLQRALGHEEALIATYLGQAPGSDLPSLPALDELRLPENLPLALPAQVLAHRPDVQVAAATLEGAAADAKAAVAARLPSFTLSANYGGSATSFGDMFASGNPFWALLGGLSQPLLRGGSLLHQSHAAKAALEAAKAQYRSTALSAFADLSDTLTALKLDGDALDAAGRGDRASAESLANIRRQFELGAVGTYQLLPVVEARAQARSQWVQSRAARLGDTVALYLALGGSPVPNR